MWKSRQNCFSYAVNKEVVTHSGQTDRHTHRQTHRIWRTHCQSCPGTEPHSSTCNYDQIQAINRLNTCRSIKYKDSTDWSSDIDLWLWSKLCCYHNRSTIIQNHPWQYMVISGNVSTILCKILQSNNELLLCSAERTECYVFPLV